MTLPAALNDREHQKFIDVAEGQTAVRVSGTITTSNSGLTTSGIVTEVSVNDTTWTALPATPLTNRKVIVIQNESGQTCKLNYDNAVSGFVGIYLKTGVERQYDSSVVIYAKCTTGTATLVVEEVL